MNEGEPYSNAAGADPLRETRDELGMLAHYAELYLSARRDLIWAYARKSALIAAALLVAVPAALTIVVCSAYMSLRGASRLAAALFGTRAWVGELLVGAGTLGLIALALFVTAKWVQRKAFRRALQKYQEEAAALAESQRLAPLH